MDNQVQRQEALRRPGGAFLSANGIHKRFGALVVLENLDFSMGDGEAVGIVGPNGAGKTTLLSVLAGAFPPNEGSITFDGVDVTRRTAAERCRSGLVRTHQIPKPFGGMTTFENVFVAASHGNAASREEAYERVVDALSLCGMLEVANRPADTLGLLDRKRLELARALATQPRLLLLDEIGGGLTDGEASELVETILELRRRGIGIVWIEHIVHILVQVAERLICMDAGRIIADGEPKTVMGDAEVVKAYLGGTPA
ncbi:ABC transporter ATP-binding protein [Rhizobium laguerreae]|nr:ABC transporter ATP-binding protein [Rhizobium laguerreae]MBY3350476.1 ABC transporter ATP-binding protein [Rhizobium laguerreae]MBY3371581.1 ABC transporter ATP-binding protein [Rhizobium laguerreae]MBY3426819.1 ABC transporter ATP-binding protein [Rhizobium laguerreae]MBY3435327.1 ABC transporter ATP-binding protein [Rhizobium laguerreae]